MKEPGCAANTNRARYGENKNTLTITHSEENRYEIL